MTIHDMPRYTGPSVELADMSHQAECMHCGERKLVWNSWSGIRAGEYVDPECRECAAGKGFYR